jgi:hypothetical protein
MKKKTLIVQDMRNINSSNDNAFKVQKVTNSIYFKIGEYLSVNTLDAYCINPDWTVNIIEFKR